MVSWKRVGAAGVCYVLTVFVLYGTRNVYSQQKYETTGGRSTGVSFGPVRTIAAGPETFTIGGGQTMSEYREN